MADLAPGDRSTATSPREAALLVFAQTTNARVAIDEWRVQAERFFSTRLGLAEEKSYAPGEVVPQTDGARIVIAPSDGLPGIRSAHGRPRDADDLALAMAADEQVGPGGTGLALVARRCQTVWLVSRALDPDPLALLLAAILASVLLGPILDVRVPELFGVKTARAKLGALRARESR